MAIVTVTCLCGRSFAIDAALAGTAFPCPTCSRSNRVPGETPPSPIVPEPLRSTIAATPQRESVADVEPASVPYRPRRKTPLWLVIAVCGLAAVALLVLVPICVQRYHQYLAEKLYKEQTELPTKQRERQAELEKEVRQGQTQLTVSGPAALQAGAANTYVLETKSLTGEAVAAKLAIRMTDKAGKEVAKHEADADHGRFAYTVPLPAALKPDDQLTLEVTATRSGTDGEPISLTEKLPLERNGFVTHITTDKPLYQPGEVVAFRSLTLDRFRLKPADEDLQLSFTVIDPSGQVVFRKDGSAVVRDPQSGSRLLEGPDGRAVHGIGFGEFAVPRNAPGGEYVLSVAELRGRFAPETRKFLVNRYQAPRLHKELEFTRRSYGPGDDVLAAARVRRIEGGTALADQPVTATILVDGKRLAADGIEKADATLSLKTDADGAVAVRFKLPKKIDSGEASLSLAFTDGGNSETIVRPIPIVVRRLRVDFYPEGGDLVASVPNRVYFAARTPLGKPAELRGRVLDAKGQSVAEIHTLADDKIHEANQGLGEFSFIPVTGQKYQLQIDSPAGIPYKAELPEVRPAGVALKVETGATASAEPIKATLWSAGEKRRLLLAAYCRGRLVASEVVDVDANGSKAVTLTPAGGVGGVFRVTVYDDRSSATVTRLVPVAERLVFRHPANYLNVSVQPDKSHYVPGEKVRLAVNAKDEAGKPAGAIALVQVVDRAALSLADDKTLRSMPTHFLLTSEIKRPEDLENADFLLGDHPLAPVAADLLLGTQGWRRFAEHDPEKFRDSHGKDAERLLASAGSTPLLVTNRHEVEIAARPLLNEASRKAQSEFSPKTMDLTTRHNDAVASIRRWEEVRDASLVIGGIGLFLVLVAVAISVGMSVVMAAEKKAPGTIGVAVGITCTCGAMMVFIVGIAALALSGSQSKTSFGSISREVAYTRDMPPPMAAGAARPQAEGADMMKQMANADRPAAPPAGAFGPMGPGMAGPMAPPPPDARPADESVKGMGGNTALVNKPESNSPTDPGYSTGTPKPPPGDSARQRYQRVMQEQSISRRTNQPTPPTERSFKELDRANRSLADANSAEPFVVREYAHVNVPGRDTRSDFTETVYWHPVLILPGGETFVNFNLSDAVTGYQATAYVHTSDGRLGAAKLEFAAKLPFSIDAKLPAEVTASDELHLPVAVANDTDARRQVRLTVDASGLTRIDGDAEAKLDVDAGKRGRAMFRYKPSITSGEAKLRFDGRSDFFSDRVERTIRVVPDGFPVIGAKGGTLARAMSANVVLPAEYTPGSLRVRAEVYPSLLADLVTGLDGMLREPHGCFEQTSSSSYPNLLILDYLNSTGQSRPEVARRAMQLLEAGYNRLVTFECQKPGGGREGYEWFGGFTPPHEALTAYGLMQFHDLGKVYDKVDPAMVERTRKFLLSRRNGQGGFTRNINYHSFGRVSDPVFNAYLTWALTESEADADLNKEVQALVQQSESNTDPYFLALIANSLFKRNDKAAGSKLLDKLVTLQSPDGALPGRESIVGSYGRDLHIEATALTVLAWLATEHLLTYREPLQKAVRWLTQQRGGFGGFGSTQATILTLKALSQLVRESKRLTPGSVILTVNGNRLLQQEFAANAQDTLTLDLSEKDLAKLKPGANEIRLEVTGENELPAKISWDYRTLQPPSADDCPIKLTTKLDKDKVNEGETVRLTAIVENTAKESRSMTVAVIGLPAGLMLPEDLKQLTELTKPRTPLAGRDTPGHARVSYFEIQGRELVLYWRGLDAGQRVEVPIDLIARTPGSYRGPASRAYLYYGADAKCWVAPLSAAIAAK